MRNTTQDDLDRPLPEPVRLKDDPPENPSFASDLYEIDSDVWAAKISEDHGREAAGKKVRVLDIMPSLRTDGWHVNVKIVEGGIGPSSKSHWEEIYDDVDLEHVEEWIYVEKAKRRVRAAIGPIEEAMEMTGDTDMKSDLEMALNLIQKHSAE